jgi:2-phospho-L-lactate guanylyltransferase
MAVTALIPVKQLRRAKMRLAPLLDEDARRDLTLAMLEDVLATAMACAHVRDVFVVSDDATVLELAGNAGANALPEPGDLNEALTRAAATLIGTGTTRLLVLAGDLPLATPESITHVATASECVVIVPSPDGGTNALALQPGTIAFQFGPGSAKKHEDAAAAGSLTVRLIDSTEIGLDIDTPQDLRTLVDRVRSRSCGRHTVDALERAGLLSERSP